jgi:hypothetical protein
MSARGWVPRQLDRPIAGRERRTATMSALLLLVAAAGLILTSPTRSTIGNAELAHPTARTVTTPEEPAPRWTPSAAAETKATAKTFLAGYLAYLYGQAPATQVKDATGMLVRAFERERLRVPPGIRALHPRIVGITVSPQTPGSVIATALISDTEVVHYPIRLILTETGSAWRVSGLKSTP